MMVYDVTYRVGQEERTDRVIAPHAAGAAERIQDSYENGEERYELLLVTLVEEPDRRQEAAD